MQKIRRGAFYFCVFAFLLLLQLMQHLVISTKVTFLAVVAFGIVFVNGVNDLLFPFSISYHIAKELYCK